MIITGKTLKLLLKATSKDKYRVGLCGIWVLYKDDVVTACVATNGTVLMAVATQPRLVYDHSVYFSTSSFAKYRLTSKTAVTIGLGDIRLDDVPVYACEEIDSSHTLNFRDIMSGFTLPDISADLRYNRKLYPTISQGTYTCNYGLLADAVAWCHDGDAIAHIRVPADNNDIGPISVYGTVSASEHRLAMVMPLRK